MRGTYKAGLFRHVGHLQPRRDAAHIHDIGLHDIDNAAVDHVFPDAHITILFAASHIDIQRVRHLQSVIRMPIGAWLFIMRDTVILQHMPDLDRAIDTETAIGIDHFNNAVTQCRGHCRDNLFGASGPFILAAPAFGTDAEFERIKALFVAKLAKTCGFIGW